ncbi:MAG: hypothetical protein U0U69_07135 [Acidimicrobiia bacterium]
MTKRPRHPNQDLEKILKLVEDHGWRVKKGSGYFKAYCACEDKHLKTIHLTPSNPRYPLNLRKWFERCSCWEARQ